MYQFKFKERQNDDQPEKPTPRRVGFFTGIENHIPGGILLPATVTATQEGTADEPMSALLHRVVIDTVKRLSYKEYQLLEPYFFSYVPNQEANQSILVRPLKLTEEEFKWFRADPAAYLN